MPAFGIPSPTHMREPSVLRYCTNCKRDIKTTLNETVCPECHEETLMPPPTEQKKARRGE